MAQNNDQEILKVENELSGLKRERETLVNDFDRKKQTYLNQLRTSVNTHQNVQLVTGMNQLISEHKRKLDNIEAKIFQVRQHYFKLLRG